MSVDVGLLAWLWEVAPGMPAGAIRGQPSPFFRCGDDGRGGWAGRRPERPVNARRVVCGLAAWQHDRATESGPLRTPILNGPDGRGQEMPVTTPGRGASRTMSIEHEHPPACY